MKIRWAIAILLMFWSGAAQAAVVSQQISQESQIAAPATADLPLATGAAIISAIAAMLSAGIAVFGKDVARHIVRPKLLLSLDNERGNHTFVSQPTGGCFGALWFHLNVETSSRLFTFNNVIVHLRELKEEAPSGQLRTVWSGRYPLTWRHEPPAVDQETGEQVFRRKTVGSLAQADVFWIHEHQGLLIGSRLPNDLGEQLATLGAGGKRVRLALVVRAVSDEGDSTPLQVEVIWNGKWTSVASDFDIEVKSSAVTLSN